MVFLSVGTQKQDFSRMFSLVEASKILENEKIIAQSGYTAYQSDKIDNIPFMDEATFEEKIKEADMIICHGGVGTIFHALHQKKTVLVIPRLAKYHEHVNDHQLEVCTKLQEMGYLLYLQDGETVDEKLKQLQETTLKEYVVDEIYLDILRKEI